MTFSIIVPIYKVELFVDACIESVLKQTCQDWELILVDDGSPDRCPEKCDEWAKNYGQIKVIHQKNKGLSAARNTGLKYASGEWIVFLDGDDSFSTDALEKFKVGLNSNIDMIIGRVRFCYSDGTQCLQEYNVTKFDEVCATHQFGQLLHSSKKESYWSAWQWIYRRTFLLNNHLWFKEGILAEDLNWTPRAIMAARKLGIITTPFYLYRVAREGSIITQRSGKLISDVLKTTDEWIAVLQENEMDSLFKMAFGTRLLWNAFSYLPDIATLQKNDQIKFYDEIQKQAEWALKIEVFKVDFLRWTIKIFKARNVGKIMWLVKKILNVLHEFKANTKN